MKLAPTEPSSATMARIREIVVARRQVISERLALENQCEEATSDIVKDLAAERIALCRRHSERLDAELQVVLKGDPQIARRYAILTSISWHRSDNSGDASGRNERAGLRQCG